MKTKLNLCLTTVLLALTAFAFCFGAVNFSENKAYAADWTYGEKDAETGTFAMVDSVKLRTDGDGFQFKAKMDKDTSESLSSNQKVYFIIIPEIYKAKMEGYGAYRAIARFTDASADNYGEYDISRSLCLYVRAVRSTLTDGYYYYYGGVSNLANVSQQKLNYYAIAVIETKNDTRGEENGKLTYDYTYATFETAAPETNIYSTITSAILNVEEDYMAEISENYSWYGKEDYPLNVASLEDYNKLVGKLNANLNLADIVIDFKEDYASDENAAEIINDSNKLYSVTFKNGDEIYKTYTVKSGAHITAPMANPTKSADNTYTYSFNSWQVSGKNFDFENETITADTVLNANYTPTFIDYTITFNMDGGTLSDSENNDITSLTAHYGDSVSELDALIKTKTGYNFTKWQYFDGETYVDLPANATVSGDTTLKAVWTISTYTVSIAVVEDGYGSVSSATVENVPYNTAVSVSDNVLTVGETQIIATPADASAQYTYAFDSWTNNPDKVTEAITITANFTRKINQYTIIFENYDGTELQSDLLNYGETPEYRGEKPVRTEDVNYMYRFNTWNTEIVSVVGNATYTATYTQTAPTYLSTVNDIMGIRDGNGDPTAYYKLIRDIDMAGQAIQNIFTSSNPFQGVFDGQGYQFKNFTTTGYGVFGFIGEQGVIKNLGLNGGKAYSTAQIAAIAYNLNGTVENVSYVQDNTGGTIRGLFTNMSSTAKVDRLVAFCDKIISDSNGGGFFSSLNSGSAENYTNVYIVANKFNENSKGACNNFDTATYKTDETFLAIGFTEIFDCTANGIWKIDDTLKLPLVMPKLSIGNNLVSKDENILFNNGVFSNTNSTLSMEHFDGSKCLVVTYSATNWQGIGIRFDNPLETGDNKYLKITFYSTTSKDIYFAAGDNSMSDGWTAGNRAIKKQSGNTWETMYISVSDLDTINWISLMPNATSGQKIYISDIELTATNS